MSYKLITPGNAKMGKLVACFSLPPVKTCKPTKWCLQGRNGKPRCYSLRGRMIWPHVVRSMENKYEASKQDNFVDRMVDEILRMNKPYFRVHVSGDFYSKMYIEKWIEIAKRCPNILFRTTTRRIDFKEQLYKLNALPNFIIRESIDPSKSKPITRLPLAAAGVKIQRCYGRKQIQCPDDCTECGHKCWLTRDDEIFDEY
jgi:hypothetical protein